MEAAREEVVREAGRAAAMAAADVVVAVKVAAEGEAAAVAAVDLAAAEVDLEAGRVAEVLLVAVMVEGGRQGH